MEGDSLDPLASPLYADLAGLPPLLLHVGADEVLRDELGPVSRQGAGGGRPRDAPDLAGRPTRMATHGEAAARRTTIFARGGAIRIAGNRGVLHGKGLSLPVVISGGLGC